MDEAGRYETFPVGQAPDGYKIQPEPEVGLEGGLVHLKDDNRNSIGKWYKACALISKRSWLSVFFIIYGIYHMVLYLRVDLCMCNLLP